MDSQKFTHFQIFLLLFFSIAKLRAKVVVLEEHEHIRFLSIQ